MRRGPRQKTNGSENDWLSRYWRRAFRLFNRRGYGKSVKRQIARRRRRERDPGDDDPDLVGLGQPLRRIAPLE